MSNDTRIQPLVTAIANNNSNNKLVPREQLNKFNIREVQSHYLCVIVSFPAELNKLAVCEAVQLFEDHINHILLNTRL